MAMRDHFHDPLNIDLRDLLLGESRIDHHLSFFLARRCSTAVCLMNSVSGTAGLPHTVSPAGMSRMIPLLAAIRTPLPIFKWPASPPCPPTMTKSPNLDRSRCRAPTLDRSWCWHRCPHHRRSGRARVEGL